MRDGFGRLVGSGDLLIGAALVGVSDAAELVLVDVDGVLVSLAAGSRRELVRVCVSSAFRVYPCLGDLVFGLQAGVCVGIVRELLPGHFGPGSVHSFGRL